jgi:hypothetical protein
VVDLCPKKVRDQLDCASGAFQPCFEQALLVQRAGEIAVRHPIIGLQRDRQSVSVRRVGEPGRRQEGIAEVEMRLRQVMQFRQRPLDQIDRRFDLSALICDDAQKMQRLGMLRVFRQRVAIERLRTPEPSRLMVSEAGIDRARDAAGAADVAVNDLSPDTHCLRTGPRFFRRRIRRMGWSAIRRTE